MRTTHFFNFKRRTSGFINIFMIVLEGYTLFKAVTSPDQQLFVLPAIYCALYLFFVCLMRLQLNWCSILILSISFIRFSILPILYNTSLTQTLTYLKYDFSNTEAVVIIMSIEALAIFCGIYLGTKHISRYKIGYNRQSKIRTCGVGTTLLLVIGFALFMRNPRLIRGFNQVADRDAAGADEAVFQVAIIIATNYLVAKVESTKMSHSVKEFGIILIFSGLIYMSSNLATSTSRNCMMINSFVLILYLSRNYHDSLKKIVPAIATLVLVYFCYSTYNRFASARLSNNVIESVVKSMFTYQSLNSYFAGPTNIDIGVSFINDCWRSLGPGRFIVDFFANIPILNKLFLSDDSVKLYNYYLSYGIAYDQIIPLVVQSAAYSYYILTPVLPFLVSYSSIIFFGKAQKSEDQLALYCNAYTAIVFAMGTILCVNSMSMLLSMRIVPVAFIGWINRKFTIGVRR